MMARLFASVVGVFWCIVAPTNALVHLTWKHNKVFNDVLPASVNVTSSVPARSLIGCARTCLQQRWCNTFFYNDVKRDCLRQRMTFQIPHATTPAMGWRYYKILSGGPDSFSDRVSGFHYRLDMRLVKEWTKGRQHCSQQGERLAVLEPVIKADFINQFFLANAGGLSLGKDIFIGAYRLKPTDPFPATGPDYLWVTGQPLNVTATSRFWWEKGRPLFDEDKGAVEMARHYNFTWKEATHNSGKRFSLCEKPF